MITAATKHHFRGPLVTNKLVEFLLDGLGDEERIRNHEEKGFFVEAMEIRKKRRRKLRNAKTSATGQIQKARNHTTLQVSVKTASWPA